jgi:hypothetical protein
MYLKQLLEAEKLAIPLVQSITVNDTCPAFILQYVPDGGTGGTACTIAFVQGGDMTVLVDAAAPAGTDAIGTAGVIDTSAEDYDTVGELCNYFNTIKAYRAICLCRPETPMANILAKSAASCLTNNGLVFYLDSSVADTTYIWSLPVTGEAFENYGLAGHVKDVDDMCVNHFHMAQATQDFTSAANAYLYIFKQGDTASTKVFTKALTDATLTDIGNTSQPNNPWYTAPEGYTLVLDIRSDVATAFTTLTFTGSTVVRKNNRRVQRVPHVAA